MAQHTLFLPGAPPEEGTILVEGDEARHAVRVKRVRPGERVLVLDGAGLVLETIVEEASRTLALRVERRERAEPVRPAVRVFGAPPKGPRAGAMVDLLSQVGAASWAPLETARTHKIPTGAKRERLERVAVEALKQCARPWLLRIDEPATLDDALAPADGARTVLADASGEPFEGRADHEVGLLIGPEGGWTEDELDRARAAGAEVRRFGPHAMRIETAAAAAAAIVLDRCARAF